MPSQKQKPKTGVYLLAVGIGCGLLLCLGTLAGSGALLVRNNSNITVNDEANLAGAADLTGEIESRGIRPTPDTPDENESEPARSSESADLVAATTDPAPVPRTPEIGPISFALETTATGEPVEPDFSFAAGITQIHAIFEYAGLSPGDTWTQVWYHNGNEVLSTSQPWLKEERGRFDYLIEAGGAPLPPGQWALEFYIDGELLAAGSFAIEGGDEIVETGQRPDPASIVKVYRLAYTKWNGEKHDLYIGDTAGNGEQFIMSRAAGPSWSPDGQYLFFYAEEGVDQQVVNGASFSFPGVTNGIARLDVSPIPTGLGQIDLFQGHGWNDGTARWANVSPDGAMIAYDGDRGGGRRIYFLGSEANRQFQIEISGEQADWSPDSRKIVFRSGRNNQTGIWISNRDGSGSRRITDGGSDSLPAWSPEGKTIAFSREVGGNVDIYTVSVDGSNLQRLTAAPGHDTLPVYLPNGDLVFRSARTGSWGIWIMRGDGANQTEIIANAPVGPEWSYSRMDVLP